ncbi:MAG: hypothetical protein ACR2FG_07145 [Marmoricola sp.]
MPEEPDETLSAEQEHRISAALASAQVTAAVPDDVAARLDATLAGLVAEREAAEPDGDADRVPGRRGRWLLLAAAASVAAVVALGVPALHPDQGRPGMATGGSGAATRSQTPPPSNAVPTPGLLGTERTPAGRRALPRLHSGSFRSDVVLLLGSASASRLDAVPSDIPGPATGGRTASCPVGPTPSGVTRQRPVLVDGHRAVLDIFAGRRGSRRVRAVSCDGTQTLASTRIPAR